MRPDGASGIAEATRDIHGWFYPDAGMLFAWIDEIQKRHGVTGNVFEIGAHHGRSSRLLAGMVDLRTEWLGVCDLFADQDQNVSGSGRGDLTEFRRNMAPVVEQGLRLRIFRRNSRHLSADEIGREHRFFHIDGGHSTAEALSDLVLAARTIVDGGVVALDDPFRPERPGVTEALIRFLDRFDQFQATILGFNKVLLTKKADADRYRTEISKEEERCRFGLDSPWHLKELSFHESPLLIFYIPSHLDPPRDGRMPRSPYRDRGLLERRILHPAAALSRGIKRALSWLFDMDIGPSDRR